MGLEHGVDSLSQKYRGLNVLVTGGAGFIGGHLADALTAGGASVRVLDDLSTGFRRNLPGGARFIEGSIEDQACVREAVQGCTAVFHLAAMVSVPASVADPGQCFRRNIIGTENVIRAAVDAGVGFLLHTSSAAVYGPNPRIPTAETDPIQCVSPYAASKAAGELLLQSACHSHGLRGASLRLFNVFGVRQDPNSPYAAVISAFVNASQRRERLRVFGDGLQTRDFIPVREVVRAFLGSGIEIRRISGQSLNVGLGNATTVLSLATLIRKASGAELDIEFLPERPGDVKHSRASIDRLSAGIGFSPNADVEQEIDRLLRGMFRTG